MGLMFPRDLEAWQRWNRPGPLRRAVSAARRRSPAAPPDGLVVVGAARPRVLVALDSANTSSQHALVAPARRLPVEEVLWLGTAEVLAAAGVLTAQETASSWPLQEGRLSGVERVLMAGSYLPAGQAAWQRARGLGCEVVVVQHGLLTPLAPPLPPEATLMAFNEQDGQFWASGRPDVTVVPVGSQAMWAAACKTSRPAAD